MLSARRSLAVTAVLALLAVYFLSIVIFVALIALDDARDDPRAAAGVALHHAAERLDLVSGRWTLAPGGSFGSLAARNSSLWLVTVSEQQDLVLGPVPKAMRRTTGVAGADGSPEPVPDVELVATLTTAVIEQRTVDGLPVVIAIGGVSPRSLQAIDILRTYSIEGALGLFLALSTVGAFALLLTIPLLRRAVLPVVEEAASIDPRDIGRRLDEARAPIELRPLARAFNGALGRLETELGRRKRLVSNVAHELRTPLAVLSLRIGGLSGPPAETEALRVEIRGLTRLVEQMLDLERLSMSAGPLAPVSLSAVAEEVCVALTPLALDAGYDVAIEAGEDPVVVLGDRHLIERAVSNLFRNAVAHGGGRGVIRISTAPGRLDVSDDGPGIPETLAPRLFDAFARGDRRSDGSGLGLHLTREIMRSFGGDVEWLRDAPQTTFRLRFPTTARH